MKFFQTVQRNLSAMGISSVQSIEKYPFNTKIATVYFNYGITMIFYFVYLDEAHDFREYTEIIYRVSVTILLTIQFTIVTIKMKKFFKYIVNCQRALEKSNNWCQRFLLRRFKRKFFLGLDQNPSSEIIVQLYVEINEQIEKWSKFTYFLIMKVSLPVFIIPKSVVSLCLYFTNLNEDSLELPLPMW